ncbi:serine/arginine repetitive matrix protein 1-like isoform X3 [Bolinopsis microptera]|uniref:serine/arginine repetitive matrix protein 1-like isoform X3 n=1 Tax=Bolinopsis microptera TaxID=2820187 RepID=UPI00307A0114
MDQPNLPYSEPSKTFGIGPPPPDIVNPLDRLARRPARLAPPKITPPFPLPFSTTPHLSAAHDTMSINFAPPSRSKINSHNSSTSPQSDKHMKDSNESSLMNEQENVVVTDVIKREDGDEGAITSDGELPPPPPPAKLSEDGDHSEEGECDSEPEDGELGDGQGDPKRKEHRHTEGRSRRDGRSRHSPRDNVIPLVKKNPGPPVPQLDPVQRKLERIASKQSSPFREPSYRDRNFRERGGDRGPERGPDRGPERGPDRGPERGPDRGPERGPDRGPERGPDRGPEMEDSNRNNGSSHEERSNQRARFPPRDNRSLDKYRREGRSMRPGDMPSLISLPPMPVISSSSKGKDFPPLSFGANAGIPPPIPPLIPPVPGAAWPPPPGPMGPLPGRHERGKDGKYDDVKMKESFDMYHKAWESYYGMSKDRPKSSREKPPHPGDRRSRTPENRDKFPAPPPAGGAHGPPPGMPGPFPGMMPGMIPGMPPHMAPRAGSKESAWERGLKVSKKIREEVRRNEKSDEESDDSHPGKLQSKIVMKENSVKSRSPSNPPKGKSTRRLSPLSDGGASSNGQHGQHAHQPYPPRLTPERYRGAYERKPPSHEDMKKPKAPHPGGDAAWHDPWMRPNSPKDRKRQHSRSSSSSDSSSNDSDSPQHKRLQELKRHIDLANRRRKAKKDAAKLKRLKEKLSPSEFELLTRKRAKRLSDAASKSKHESDSDSASDDSSSSSSSAGSISPGNYAGKLADSPTSPVSSPDFSYKDKKKTKEVLIRQLQKVEKQLEKKKKDEKRRHS